MTPVQKQRLLHGIEQSVTVTVTGDHLPAPVRQREAALESRATLSALRCFRGRASRQVGRSASLSLPLGDLRTYLSCADRDASCGPEAQVEVVGVRGMFASSVDAAAIGRALRDFVPNGVSMASPIAGPPAERSEPARHRGDGRDLFSGELQGRSSLASTSASTSARRQSRTPRHGVGAAPRVDGGRSRRSDLCGSPPVDSGWGNHARDVDMAGPGLRVCHRWPRQLPDGQPEPEPSSGSGSCPPP